LPTTLTHLTRKIDELETLAGDVLSLADRLRDGDRSSQPDLSIKGQRWYRGARAVLTGAGFSGLKEFDACYSQRNYFTDMERYLERGTDPSQQSALWSTEMDAQEHFGMFSVLLRKARSLLLSVVDELLAREMPVKTELSLAVTASEFEAAEELLSGAKGQEVFIRASGVMARVALERHLLTVADSRSLAIVVNPPHKARQDTNDILTTLQKASVITPIQRSEFETLFKIGNNCAHPREQVAHDDVIRMIQRARELAAVIL
jgi:hypothetical protein